MFKENNKFEKFESKVWLSSPTMHGLEIEYVKEAYETNWMSTVGKNINEVERMACEYIGCKYAVALSAGTASLHLAMKLAGIEAYGMPKVGHGALEGKKVFCSDMTFDATVNPVVYEGGEPVFIDTEYDTWNMDPVALEKAFEIYPDTKVVVVAHLYGTPGKVDELNAIIKKHGAILVEDAAESMGATYKGVQTGTFGKYNTISFNGNKIITGSAGGCFLTDDEEAANKVRKWSTQSRENAPWYQHEELGYNYRMSNVIAGVIRGQIPYLEEHIAQKKAIYMRYKEAFKDLPVSMNPYDKVNSDPNFWLSCLIIDKDAMCKQVRGEKDYCYNSEKEALFARIRQGDQEAREMYIKGNLRLVLSVIKRFSGSHENLDDLFQIGCIGLIKSIDNFNPDLQVKFSTYAVPMIIGEIRRYLRDNNSIRVSRSLRDTAYKAIHAKEVLSKNSFKEPTLQEIAEESGVAAEDILYALDAIQSPVSLYDPVYTDGGDTLYVMDQISDKKNKEENWVEKLSLSDAMNHLSERENFIINLRFFEGKTQMEVADEIHISQAQVSRLEKSALKTIRQYLTL